MEEPGRILPALQSEEGSTIRTLEATACRPDPRRPRTARQTSRPLIHRLVSIGLRTPRSRLPGTLELHRLHRSSSHVA